MKSLFKKSNQAFLALVTICLASSFAQAGPSYSGKFAGTDQAAEYVTQTAQLIVNRRSLSSPERYDIVANTIATKSDPTVIFDIPDEVAVNTKVVKALEDKLKILDAFEAGRFFNSIKGRKKVVGPAGINDAAGNLRNVTFLALKHQAGHDITYLEKELVVSQFRALSDQMHAGKGKYVSPEAKVAKMR